VQKGPFKAWVKSITRKSWRAPGMGYLLRRNAGLME
jgi:hypothetical protein